jgi:hypothetical protein
MPCAHRGAAEQGCHLDLRCRAGRRLLLMSCDEVNREADAYLLAKLSDGVRRGSTELQ